MFLENLAAATSRSHVQHGSAFLFWCSCLATFYGINGIFCVADAMILFTVTLFSCRKTCGSMSTTKMLIWRLLIENLRCLSFYISKLPLIIQMSSSEFTIQRRLFCVVVV
jgi:hypothetical protein